MNSSCSGVGGVWEDLALSYREPSIIDDDDEAADESEELVDEEPVEYMRSSC
jgi:hypothetical protein